MPNNPRVAAIGGEDATQLFPSLISSGHGVLRVHRQITFTRSLGRSGSSCSRGSGGITVVAHAPLPRLRHSRPPLTLTLPRRILVKHVLRVVAPRVHPPVS